jgi:hypothetical protein
MKHEKKKTEVTQEVQPLPAELQVEKAFTQYDAEQYFQDRSWDSEQTAEAGEDSSGQ